MAASMVATRNKTRTMLFEVLLVGLNHAIHPWKELLGAVI
jgi:hypothetical protein